MKDLKTLYQEELKPQLRKLEKERRFILKRKKAWRPWKISCVCIGSLIVLLIQYYSSNTFLDQWHIGRGSETWTSLSDVLSIVTLSFVGILGFAVPAVMIGEKIDSFKEKYRSQIVQCVVKFIDKSYTFSSTRGISWNEFETSKIFSKYIDSFESENLVTGKMNKTKFAFSEVEAGISHDSAYSKIKLMYETIFNGLFFVIDFNKNFSSNTHILTDKAERLFGFLGTKLQAINPSREKLVQLEGPEFEHLLVVYSSNKIEARYLLSPSNMKSCVKPQKTIQNLNLNTRIWSKS